MIETQSEIECLWMVIHHRCRCSRLANWQQEQAKDRQKLLSSTWQTPFCFYVLHVWLLDRRWSSHLYLLYYINFSLIYRISRRIFAALPSPGSLSNIFWWFRMLSELTPSLQATKVHKDLIMGQTQLAIFGGVVGWWNHLTNSHITA